MTEYGPYRPDQTPQGNSQERLVFVDPADRHGREFEITTPPDGTRPVIGGDSPEVNQAVADAYEAVRQERIDAAARTAEHDAEDAELARAIDWNAQAIEATRGYVEVNGF